MSVDAAFKALGLTDTATGDEVKAAFRKLAALHHPDVSGDPVEFDRLRKAYTTVMEFVEAPKLCKTCKGSGRVVVVNGFSSIHLPCEDCGGVGTVGGR